MPARLLSCKSNCERDHEGAQAGEYDHQFATRTAATLQAVGESNAGNGCSVVRIAAED